jgi:hypothetical protein
MILLDEEGHEGKAPFVTDMALKDQPLGSSWFVEMAAAISARALTQLRTCALQRSRVKDGSDRQGKETA